MSTLLPGPAAATEPRAATPRRGSLDAESRAWLEDLRARGARHDDAVERLHALLLRAARFEVSRRRASLPYLRGDDLQSISTEAADDALMSILRRLDDFRGASRFTTWAYKFALLEAAVKLRRRAWQNREIGLDSEVWDVMPATGAGPDERLEQGQIIAALRTGIRDALTPHQRRVFVALALNEVPIDVLAGRLGTTRGALYKTLHDARKRLRAHLVAAGAAPQWMETEG
jgi:RNA polymerase sigma-70 factor (ECF subfamily)